MNDEYYEWVDNRGRSSFELAPMASAFLLAALFGGVGSWTYCLSRDAVTSFWLALGAIVLGCIGLAVDTTWDDDGLLVPCDEHALPGNLGIGILLGIALGSFLSLMSGIAAGRRGVLLRKKIYTDQGQTIAGTVVRKSTETIHGSENNYDVYYLHIRYKFRGSPSYSGGGGGGGETVQWSYRLDDEEQDLWTNYDDDSNAALERAYREEKRFSPVIMASNIVDYSTMLQTDASTGLRQAVRRTTRDDCIAAAALSDDERPYAEPGYACDDENVHPFKVTKTVHDQEAKGNVVDLLGLPGNPFSVQLKSEFETSRCGDAAGGFGLLVFFTMCCWPLPLMLGFYLPLRILNWKICRNSLIMGLSTMVVTVILLSLGCRLACRPKGSLTHEEARDTIAKAKDKLVEGLSNEERELSHIRQKLAVLSSLEDAVVRHLQSANHHDHRATQSGLLARHLDKQQKPSLEEVVTDELFVLTRQQLRNWIQLVLYQADASRSRSDETTHAQFNPIEYQESIRKKQREIVIILVLVSVSVSLVWLVVAFAIGPQ